MKTNLLSVWWSGLAVPACRSVCRNFSLGISLSVGLLAGCGGGADDPGPPVGTETQTGRVAAGSYVQNAVVFLDLNDNNLLDSHERRTTTDASGRYTLSGLHAADVAQHAIVARIFPDAIDVQTGQPVGLDGTLKAPPGRGAFVSPYTSLVAGLVAGTPSLAEATAAAQVGNRLRSSTLAWTAPSQLDPMRDYVADAATAAAATATATSSDSRQLRLVAGALAGILSSATAGMNERQSLFDANTRVSYDAVVRLTETQLTQVASGTWQFEQFNAAQRADLVNNPGAHANFFVNGNDLVAALVSAINVSDLGAAVKDWVVNSDAFKQFVASLILDLTASLAELILKILF